MTWMRNCALILAFVCASSAFSQDTSCLRRTVPLSILSAPVTPVAQITSSDLRAEFRGKPVPIVGLSSHVPPHRVLILLDASGSMQGSTAELWPAAIYVAVHFADSNLLSTSIGLFVFGTRAGDQIPFSQGNAAVRQKLHEIISDPKYAKERVYGMTPLRDAILEGVKMFGTPEIGDSILLISDGGENASHSKEGVLPTDLLAHGIRLFFCAFLVSDGGPAPEEREGLQDLLELAANTGGLAVEPFGGLARGGISQFWKGQPRGRALPTLMTLDRQMTNYALVDFVLPTPLTKRERWTLSLTKEKSHELKGPKLLYPQELLPCGVAGAQEPASSQHP